MTLTGGAYRDTIGGEGTGEGEGGVVAALADDGEVHGAGALAGAALDTAVVHVEGGAAPAARFFSADSRSRLAVGHPVGVFAPPFDRAADRRGVGDAHRLAREHFVEGFPQVAAPHP